MELSGDRLRPQLVGPVPVDTVKLNSYGSSYIFSLLRGGGGGTEFADVVPAGPAKQVRPAELTRRFLEYELSITFHPPGTVMSRHPAQDFPSKSNRPKAAASKRWAKKKPLGRIAERLSEERLCRLWPPSVVALA